MIDNMNIVAPAWIRTRSSPVLHAEFTTHSNYLNFVSQASSGLVLTINTNQIPSNSISVLANKKVRLAKLTMNNIDSEMDQINRYRDYAQICSSWIPVKSYYLFFNLLMVIEWLIEDDVRWLTETHEAVNRKMKEVLRTNSVTFNNAVFNQITPANQVNSWIIPSGSNIIIGSPDPNVRYQQIIKKILEYKTEDFKRRRKILRLAGQVKQNFLSATDLNLWEFLYWYRVKANYRDMEFLESGVDISDFYLYYLNYHTLCNNFYSAFTNEINRISQAKYSTGLF